MLYICYIMEFLTFLNIFNIFSLFLHVRVFLAAGCHEAQQWISKQTFLFVIRCSQYSLAHDDE